MNQDHIQILFILKLFQAYSFEEDIYPNEQLIIKQLIL
jgi:hypothetical protein